MNKEMILQAMNGLDDADIMAAAPLTGAEKARVSRRRWTRVAVIAACLVVVLGAVAYATGLLDTAFTIYRSAESDEKMYITDENGVVHDSVQILLEVAYMNENVISGPIRKDAAAMLKKKQDKGDIALEYAFDSNTGEKLIYDFYQVDGHTSFDSTKEMLDYIGCKGLEVPYFPYDGCKYCVDYAAELNKDDDPDKLKMFSCYYRTYDPDEGRKIKVELMGNMMLVPGDVPKDTTAKVGIDGYIDDNNHIEELFTTRHGSSGIKIYTADGPGEWYAIHGCVVKNDFCYRIFISCDWADKAEADQIFQTWADSL